MIRSLKFSKTEKILAGALSIVALSAGAVLADQQPTGQTMAIESSADSSQIANLPVVTGDMTQVGDGLIAPDATTTDQTQGVIDTTNATDPADASTTSSGQQGAGNVNENVNVTVDGKDVAPDSFGSNGVSVDTANSGTLDDSNNGTDVNVDRSVDQNTRTRNRVRTNNDLSTNVGGNDVSGNLHPVTVHNGDVKINFSLPH